MHRILYSVVFYLALPVILLRLLLRSLRSPAYRRRIGERFALQSPDTAAGSASLRLWVHAVSVGETVASAPLIKALQHSYPEAQILVTTMTPTGSDRVRSLFGASVAHCYIPYDLPGSCKRFLNKYQPDVLILMETELWPNLIWACHRQSVKLILANARLSEKSAAGYARFAGFSRELLSRIDVVAAQATPDAERFVELGMDRERTRVTGSLKFIIEQKEQQPQPYFAALKESGRPIVIAASTRDGEEEKVLTAFQQCLSDVPDALLLLVPRHPERFDRVARLVESKGLNTVRRSAETAIDASSQVIIGDSMGEMLDYYSAATVAFVGGSLVDTGCQNVLEPAALGIPIVVGPSQYNFATICSQLERVGALRTVQDEVELAQAVISLFADEGVRRTMGDAGLSLIRENQEALPKLLSLIEPLVRTDG